MRKISIILVALMLGGCTHMRFALHSGECPSEFPIKGNANSFKYHLPSSPWYYRTKAEVCFANEEAARRNGYVSTKHN